MEEKEVTKAGMGGVWAQWGSMCRPQNNRRIHQLNPKNPQPVVTTTMNNRTLGRVVARAGARVWGAGVSRA